jgi:riboflavin biosynthesis pyrimidine reductase
LHEQGSGLDHQPTYDRWRCLFISGCGSSGFDSSGFGSSGWLRLLHLHGALSACADHLERFGGHRAAAGLEPEPIVATISRRLDLPADIPLLAEPTARLQVYTEADGEVPSQGAWVAVQRFEPGHLTMPAILEHLRTERGARTILCEGGPRLLRELVAADCVDDLMLTLAPMLVAGDAPTPLSGPLLDPPAGMALRDIHRADDHLFLHYTL